MRNIKLFLCLVFIVTMLFGCNTTKDSVKDGSQEDGVEETAGADDSADDIKYTIYFAPDSYNVDFLMAAKLDSIIKEIKQEEPVGIEIVGHSAKLNKKRDEDTISRKRAYAVAEYFERSGLLDNLNVSVEGVGSSVPALSHDEITARGGNRRVEIKIEK